MNPHWRHAVDKTKHGIGATDPPNSEAKSGAPLRCFLSPRDIAELTGLNVAVVRRAIDRGELRAHKLCSRLRIRREDFEAWITASVVEQRRR